MSGVPIEEVIKCIFYKRRYQGKGYASIKCCGPLNIGFSSLKVGEMINLNTVTSFSTTNSPVMERNNYMDRYCKNDHEGCQFFKGKPTN